MVNRRHFLGGGLSKIALASLLAEEHGPIVPQIDPKAPLTPRKPHFPARAKRVLMFFCSGGVSHVDTFDYKPELFKRHDQPLPGAESELAFQGGHGHLHRPLWAFRPRGQTGKMISDLLPHLALWADRLAFVHSMTAKTNTHGQAENQMSTGFTLDGFPSIGSWVSYALGSENRDLPAFVAIPDPRGVPQVGPNNWNNAFLPAVFQGTAFNADEPIPHLRPPKAVPPVSDAATRQLLRRLNQRDHERHPNDTERLARIASWELAGRMQVRALRMMDLSGESRAIRQSYGIDQADRIQAGFARNCLLARRLLESGVRFVEVFNGAYAMGEGVGNWDAHKNLKNFYTRHAAIFDRPAAALLRDLEQRGLLADTLVVWVTEFGRMPTFQKNGASGRDHNHKGFTVWLAGAGIKAGTSYGATDEFGYQAVEKRATIYDLHATILHLLGLDHERLSVYHDGTQRRLTDVHGRVLEGILA
ncbi:MAG: DUF1501 domain-containing protein [Gemmataceae bacterium]